MTQEEGKGMNGRLCESSGCFDVYEWNDQIAIRGANPQWIGIGVDTVESWRTFRDDIKAGKYDHIGEVS